MVRRNLIILGFIVLLALILRFFDLGSVPVGFHRDEANFGYNAYALLNTGRDLTGNFLPIHISSFLNSPGGYSYLTIPFISLFGLTEFAVRFTSALFGTATILLTYFFVRQLFGKSDIALLSAFFLSISPWHINLSRVATENVIVVFLLVLALMLYLQWTKRKKFLFLLISFICFGGTLLLYQAPRAFLPLFLPFLFLLFHPVPLKKKIITPILLFLVIIILPVVSILSSHDLSQRIRMLSIFQHPATQLMLDEQIREDVGSNTNLTRFFHNKVTSYVTTFSSNYFSHFSYNFLFTDAGLPDRYRVAQMGLLYFFELPLLLFGLWKLLLDNKKLGLFLGGWILLAPFGSAFTFDDIPNLQRTLIMFPALSIISAYGFLSAWKCLEKIKFGKVGQVLLVLIITYGVFYYLHQYYVHQVNHRPWFRQEGYKQLFSEIEKVQPNYQKIIFTDAESDPGIFFLFYNQYSPSETQRIFKNSQMVTTQNLRINKYQFTTEPCPLRLQAKIDPKSKLPILSGEKNILYINGGNCKSLDKRVKVLSTIKRHDGTTAFSLVTIEK